MKTTRVLLAVGLLLLIMVTLGRNSLRPAPQVEPTPIKSQIAADKKPRVIETFGKLPLHFEANQGQTDERVKFLSRGRGGDALQARVALSFEAWKTPHEPCVKETRKAPWTSLQISSSK